MVNINCNNCKLSLDINNFSKNNKNDKLYKSCNDCRVKQKIYSERYKCEHKKRKSYCRECGGGGICEHQKQKSTCKECEGGNICQHKKIKSKCIKCGGGSICKHNKIKSICKDCGGGSICEHKIQKRQCKICDPLGHLSQIVRGRIYKSLKNNKELSSQNYLGCNIEELKIHIENQFLEGMSWENYGEWHIDHITPLKYQNPTLEESIERLHFSNTQPLWATDNMSKGNRFIG
jgi:hypothetical protein